MRNVTLFLAVGFVIVAQSPRVFSQKDTLDHRWILPLRIKTVITSCYGHRHLMHKFWDFHQGIDFSAKVKTPVQSIADGTVIWSGFSGCAGRALVLEHHTDDDRTIFSIYKHLKSFSVKPGEQVLKGQYIALSGASGTPLKSSQAVGHRGCVEGAHLHFELKLIKPGRKAAEIEQILHKTHGHISDQVMSADPAEFWPQIKSQCGKGHSKTHHRMLEI
jgi:murein DD-endopeptidase MepM/ murein hydrolase activator NlpD